MRGGLSSNRLAETSKAWETSNACQEGKAMTLQWKSSGKASKREGSTPRPSCLLPDTHAVTLQSLLEFIRLKKKGSSVTLKCLACHHSFTACNFQAQEHFQKLLFTTSIRVTSSHCLFCLITSRLIFNDNIAALSPGGSESRR